MVPLMLFVSSIAATAASLPSVVLGRPTDRSVTMNVLASADSDCIVEHGLASGAYSLQTSPRRFRAGVPEEMLLDGLEAGRQYFYRLQCRASNGAGFTPGDECVFQTQRPRGSTFTFAIEADPHLDSNTSPELLERSLGNVLARRPDFLVDLGDTSMTEKLGATRQGSLHRYKLLRSKFDVACHSVPLFLVIGNHDGETGGITARTPDNIAVWSTNLRKQYFAGPEPDAFYSGDETSYPFVGLRQSTYSWEWGDTLFVILDPFWNTMTRGTGWAWTLGRDQYTWLDRVLRGSHAKFKFVFIHHLVGGLDSNARGGIEAAPFYEWGGRGVDGTFEFATRRSGWEKPIHELLVETGVTAVFHGHDHFFAKQTLDGIVYQEVPQPAWPGLTLPNPSANGYSSGVFLPSSGDLFVTVSPDRVLVEYVRAVLQKDETADRRNGAVAYSYTIEALSQASRRRAVRR